MIAFEELKAIHLELTDKCNAACPQCARNDYGGAVNPRLPLAELSLEDIRRMLPGGLVRRLERVYACGSYGDPAMASEALDVFQYLRGESDAVSLGMHTNGGARQADWWSKLAETMPAGKGCAWFAIDGLADTNRLYRRNVLWRTVLRNAEAFIQAGGWAEWDFIVFKHNEHQVEAARSLAREMGFAAFNAKRTARFMDPASLESLPSTPVKDAKGTPEYSIEPPIDPRWEHESKAGLDRIREKYGSMRSYLDKTEISCQAAAQKKIYVTSEGTVLVCCWLSLHFFNQDWPGKYWHDRDSSGADPLLEMIKSAGGLDAINAKLHPLQDILEGRFFQELMPASYGKSIGKGRIPICARACGSEPLTSTRLGSYPEAWRTVFRGG